MIREHRISMFVVKCDLCGTQNRSVADGFGLQVHAEEDAYASGWVYEPITERHLCRDCKATVIEPA